MNLRKLAVLLPLACSVTLLHAQDTRGRINGLVTDPTGAVIPTATIVLHSEETHAVTTRHADSAGAYSFDLLNPGLYTIDVTAPGFKQFEEQHIRVEVASHVGINAKLQIGAADQTVTVTESGGARLDTEDAVLGYTIEQRSAMDLPILYSNPFELQLLAPGVNSTSLSTGNHTYEGGTESAVVNGSQSGRTEFTLDGAPDTRNGGAVTTAYIPSRDFVQESKLITSPYDASLSHTSGASLDTSLKSGTSQFHGGAQIFEQFPNVDAPQFSQGTSVAPAQKFNRESGELDGPIIPRKLFFFVGYEKQYNKAAASTSSQTVPTVAEKQGDFSALYAAGKMTPITYTCPTTKQKITTIPYNTYQIFNPYSTHPDPNCPGSYLRDAIPGNILSNAGLSIDPVAAKILSYYPTPNGSASEGIDGSNNFVSTVPNVDYYWNFANRIDYNITDRQKLFGHLIHSRRRQPGKNLFFPGASGKTNTLVNWGTVLDYVNTINSTTVADVRYSFTRFYTTTTIDAKTTATDLGINANATAGAPSIALGFPYVHPSGYSELGNADPSAEYDNVQDAQINISKVLGRQNIHFGVEWRTYQANQADYTDEKLFIASNGTYVEGPSNITTQSGLGFSIASMELGIAENTSERLNNATTNNTTYWAGFFQDDWKLTPKFTLNLGLRYEYGSPITERNGKSITNFDMSATNPIAAQAKTTYAATSNSTEQGLVPVSAFTVNGGVRYATPGQPLWNAQKLNFSPRVGFAYNPFPKLVVRGGFGIFYQHYAEYVQYGNPLGYTQTTNTVATTDNGQTYSATLQNPFPNGLVQPSGNSLGLLQNVGQSISQFYEPNPSTPYTEHYSLGFQYELPSSIIASVDYVGTLGRHLTLTRDFNATPDQYLSTSPVRNDAMNSTNGILSAKYPNPFYGVSVPGCTLCTQTTIAGSQLVKPFPEFTGLTARDNSGMSSFNSLQVSVQKRFSHGYNMSASYQWSRTLDALSFLNAGDVKPWYGISNTDYPQTLSVAGIYELPFGHGKPFFSNDPAWVDEIIHGFQVEGTYRIASGQPITFGSSSLVLRPGETYADLGGPSLHNYAQWFNTHAVYNVNDQKDYSVNYALVSNLRTFPLRFNNVRQDYQNLLNVGAMKKFKLYERVNMDVRAEAINALNHQVYSNPNTDPSSSSFGKIGGPGNTARILQFAVEANF